MRNLYLHIGAHKTGTTALQQGLHQNRVLLRAHDCAYIAAATAAHLHSFLGNATNGQFLPEGYRVLDPESLTQRFAFADARTVVASSENFSFFFDRPAIDDLARMLRPLFDRVHIVCYLRRQDRHAVSHHQEGAKPHRYVEGLLWGHQPTALPEYAPHQDLYLDYNHRLGLWADAFGDENMIVRPYDRALLKNGDIFQDFLAQIGMSVSGLATVGDRNVSLGAAQTKAGHLMNSVKMDAETMGVLLGHIEKSGRLMPARAEAMHLLDRYRDSNRRLNQRLHVSPLPDLFNDDFSDYPETAQQDWTEDQANAALRGIFGQLALHKSPVPAPSPDDLRDAVIALKETNPAAARRLIQIAHTLRPAGPAINRLKAELEPKPDES